MRNKYLNINVLAVVGWFITFLLWATIMVAQPGNPSYSISSNTFFEVDINPVALIDIETTQASASFAMLVPVPTEAGEGFASNPLVSNSDNWINYSSGVPPTVTRKVQVSINSGTLPSGFELHVKAGAATGSGGGVLGTPASGSVVLSGSPQDIISGIRGAYTGDGANNGHQLTYELHYGGSNFSAIESEVVNINILYTIIDN